MEVRLLVQEYNKILILISLLMLLTPIAIAEDTAPGAPIVGDELTEGEAGIGEESVGSDTDTETIVPETAPPEEPAYVPTTTPPTQPTTTDPVTPPTDTTPTTPPNDSTTPTTDPNAPTIPQQPQNPQQTPETPQPQAEEINTPIITGNNTNQINNEELTAIANKLAELEQNSTELKAQSDTNFMLAAGLGAIVLILVIIIIINVVKQ